MAVACFSHFIIYDFDGTAPGPGLSWRASVAGVALSCAPQSFHNLSCTFSPAPTAPPSPLGQQSSLFLSTLRLRVATRSPCRCACALGPRLGFGEGRGRGTGRLAVSQGEHSVTVERLVSFNLFHLFTTSTPYFKLYHVLQIGPLFGGAGNPQHQQGVRET